jgi:NAD+ synthase (glutamine-hydrolysing)
LFPHGIFRITAAAPPLSIANPKSNAEESIRAIDASDADLVLLPELGLTGYTCGDLFGSDALLRGALKALETVAENSRSHESIVVVGLPLVVETSLMNCAAVVSGGRVCGIVPKTFLPTYREFYEARHFRGASASDPATIKVGDTVVPFGTGLLFNWGDASIGVEICEDLWTPIQPSSHAAIAGANVLLNLSASNETIGKAAWRRDLVRSQSGRCIAAYAYASSGPGESTSDLVFGGHCLIAENGGILDESRRVGDGKEPTQITETSVTSDIDLQRLAHDRRVMRHR